MMLKSASLRWRGFLLTLTVALPNVVGQQRINFTTEKIREDGIHDPAMSYFYKLIHWVVELMSNRPFPHEKLIDQKFMSGNLEQMQQSVLERRNEWLLQERWFLGAAAGVIILSALFTIFYVLYRCCVCCCTSGKPAESSDGPLDGCKRTILNVIFTALVLVNIFAAVALLLCSQYATMSVEKVNDAVSFVHADLEAYKKDNELQVNDLLGNKFEELQARLLNETEHIGPAVVKALVQRISADPILQLRDIEDSLKTLSELADGQLNNDIDTLNAQLKKVKQFCSNSPSVCGGVVPNVDEIEHINVVGIKFDDLSPLIKQLDDVGDHIQVFVNERIGELKTQMEGELLKLSQVRENIIGYIRDVNFRQVSELGVQFKSLYDENKNYVNAAWIATLVISALMFFIALCFLFGVFYGFCGSRASYYNDDCCVKPTGSRFYSCGIVLAVTFMFVLAVASSALMLLGSAMTDLVCDPWTNPTNRPEMLDLLDRVIQEKMAYIDESSPLQKIMKNSGSVKKIVNGCNEGQTFVQMLGVEKKMSGNWDVEEVMMAAYGRLNDHLLNAVNNNKQLSVNIQPFQENLADIFRKVDEISESNITTHFADSVEMLDGTIKFVESNERLPVNLNDLKRTAIHLRAQIEKANVQLKKISQLPNKAKLLLANNNLGNSELIMKEMSPAIVQAVRSVGDRVVEYVADIKHAMNTTITSCQPVATILTNARIAVCDHIVDPLNGVWMSVLISVLLYVPVVLLATSLSRLYDHVVPYTKYSVHEPHTEAAFATDDYGLNMPNSLKYPSSQPYGSRNYGYQDAYPPPYLGNQYRYRR